MARGGMSSYFWPRPMTQTRAVEGVEGTVLPMSWLTIKSL